MAVKDYYKVLGAALKDAAGAIKKKYRALAKEHHPDANNGDKKSEELFKKITEAYEVLSDDKKRKAYDRERVAAKSRQSYSGGGSAGNSSGAEGKYGPYDHSRSGPRQDWRQQQDPFSQSNFTEDEPPDPNMPMQGFDLQFMAELPLVTVALGGKIDYAYEKFVQCPECEGMGTDDEGDCPECKGKRQVVKQIVLEVDIPPGLVDNYTYRVKDQGGEGRNGGPPGDLLLKITPQPHPTMKRIKNDIYAQVNISQKLADEGGSLQVQTLDSLETIEVEDGTLTGEEYRLVGKGGCFPWDKKRGDFIVKFFILED